MDREKVISEIENEIRLGEHWDEYCRMIDLPLLKDALALLKQEAVEPVHKNAGDFCGRCDSYIRWSDKYCPECGARVMRGKKDGKHETN